MNRKGGGEVLGSEEGKERELEEEEGEKTTFGMKSKCILKIKLK